MERLIAICAGLVVLFVVVCPITPTPTAVIGGNAQLHAPAVAVVSIVFTSAPRLDRSFWTGAPDLLPVISSSDRLDLTCARLC